MHQRAITTYSWLPRLRNSLQIATMPSNNTRPVTGSLGGGCAGGGDGCGEADARLATTMASSSAVSFGVLPCCFRSLFIFCRHDAASFSDVVEIIKLCRSNSRSSQSFL